ncbi:acyl carrier protein [Melittangium boletus]|uniref:Acyl carrier protein n=1 Tax=Melittangium boletus DSM 14713 TaxID=1294270 RepID=A0A250IQI7_9BACT|nr:acyl carrier protein [Melittangium boletus]ATB33512.1 acyl carrier protein [Melittangium boletus DSM 14713]
MSAREKIRQRILTNYLVGESPENLTDDTPLLGYGVLNSMSTLDLVNYIETEFLFEVAPQEVNDTNFGTVASLVAFVQRRAS